METTYPKTVTMSRYFYQDRMDAFYDEYPGTIVKRGKVVWTVRLDSEADFQRVLHDARWYATEYQDEDYLANKKLCDSARRVVVAMTHQSNRRQTHTFIILAKGEEIGTVTCSNDRARNLVRKYRRTLKCNVRAISC